MRLKQLLSVITLLLVLSAVGLAANSQLTNVSAAAQGNATVITLHTSGAFTHAEYRPTDTLLLVDLSGVSAGKWNELTRNLSLPGVAAYHVLGYTGTTGTDVARVEITLAPGAVVDVKQTGSDLNVKVAGNFVPVSASSQPVAAKEDSAPIAKPADYVLVKNVSVVRGEETLNIEITANGKMTANTMTLSSPARVVVDIQNSQPLGRNKTIDVNSGEIKDVRIGRFQEQPPVTRIVVDLTEPREFKVVPMGDKLVVKVHDVEAAKAQPVTTLKSSAVTTAPPSIISVKPAKDLADVVPAKPVTKPALVATSAPEAASRKDFVMLEPTYHPAPATNDPKAMAEAAAQVIQSNMTAQERNLLPQASASMGPAPQQSTTITQAPAARPKYTGEPISVNLKDVDLKDFFRLIHEISGLNIVLDPNVRGTLTLVLDDVPWDQALDLVLQNNGLDRVLEGNVLRIATVDTLRKEAEAIRAKNEAEALSVPRVTVTHFLSYARATDVVPTVKKFLSSRGDVVADNRTNALIIQDIPSVMPPIQNLLVQLDRKTQEVEIEARVIAATRSFARDIGTQLGFGLGNNSGTATAGGASAVGSSPNQVGYFAQPPYFTVPGITSSSGTSTTAASIPLFSNLAANSPTSGLNFVSVGSNYRLDAILTMAESRGLVKILSRPRVVTQNNVQAVVKQGVSIPIVTAAQLGGPPTTTFVQAFLRLTVTPQITIENTIFLNLDVENTTPDFSHEVLGNPSLLTQQATTSVLVTDGGTAVIGGVIQTTNSVTINQVPLLGDIPIIGNAFKHRSVSTQTQELLFFITPKIIQT